MIKRYDGLVRGSAIALTAFFVIFGGVTLVRSAFQKVHKTDLTVYLRAAWAVRTGEDLYAVEDEHGWHYHYPPLTAAILTPFAQPPAGSDEKALVPFPTMVVLWYCVSIFCAILAVHRMAATVGNSSLFRAGKYRFWLAHVPIWVLAPALASSLGRGQVNEWILLLLALMISAAVAGQRFLAGACLACAICIKVIPLYLIIYPLWRRDGKWLAGTAVGLIFGMLVVPAAVIGPRNTMTTYAQWGNKILHPALLNGPAGERDAELLGITATDNQSIQAMLHNTTHLARETRPAYASPLTRIAHWLIGGLLTIITITVGSRSTLKEPHREALAISSLFVPMLLISPVAHQHYFVLLFPLVMSLIGSHLAYGQRVRPALAAVLAVNFLANLMPRIPGCEVLRDIGFASWGAILLWIAALVELSGEAVLKVKLPGANYAREIKRKWAARYGGRAKPPTVQTSGNG
jgi:hypothetical protein